MVRLYFVINALLFFYGFTWAQTLRLSSTYVIPDSISPGQYYQVNLTGEIFILADNGIFNINKKKWIIKPRPFMPVISFSTHPLSGNVDYVTIYDMLNSNYKLCQFVDLDTFYQMRLIREFDHSKKIVYPLQSGNELFLFWENKNAGCGFGKVTDGDSIVSIFDFHFGVSGPFNLINRNSLLFYLDNVLFNYHGNSGLKNAISISILPSSICIDGSGGLYLSVDTGIYKLGSDEKLSLVYSGAGGSIKFVSKRLYNYLPSDKSIQVLVQ